MVGKNCYVKNIKVAINLPNATSIGNESICDLATSKGTSLAETIESFDFTLNAPKIVSAGDSFLSRLIV